MSVTIYAEFGPAISLSLSSLVNFIPNFLNSVSKTIQLKLLACYVAPSLRFDSYGSRVKGFLVIFIIDFLNALMSLPI